MPEAELLSRPPEEAVPLHERLRARHAVLQWRSVDSVVFALSDPIDAVLAHEIYSNEYENSGDWNVLVVDESFAASRKTVCLKFDASTRRTPPDGLRPVATLLRPAGKLS
ncbi:MAG: hypothetical protein AAF411_04335 [Myxococcota bacterium]